jgi:hypothetical protein
MQRGLSATVASERRQIGLLDRFPSADLAPTHAAQRLCGVLLTHRPTDAPDLSIEGARTYAHAISTGAVAVFRVILNRPSGTVRRVAARAGRVERFFRIR